MLSSRLHTGSSCSGRDPRISRARNIWVWKLLPLVCVCVCVCACVRACVRACIVGVWSWSYLWASLVAQAIKNLPAMQGPRFDPWIRKIPWGREWQPSLGYASISCPVLGALLSQILWKQYPARKFP